MFQELSVVEHRSRGMPSSVPFSLVKQLLEILTGGWNSLEGLGGTWKYYLLGQLVCSFLEAKPLTILMLEVECV